MQSDNVKVFHTKHKSSWSKRGAVCTVFLIFFSSTPPHLSFLQLLLCLRAGVSFPAAALVLVRCSCGVQLVLLPTLQSHPWSKLGGESLQSRVPETLLCAPLDWCSPASLRRHTCSKGGGVSGGRVEVLKGASLTPGNGTGMGSESATERLSSSWQIAPLWAPVVSWGWRTWGWFVVVSLVMLEGHSLKIVQGDHPGQVSPSLGWGYVAWRGSGYQGGWWMWFHSFSEKWCGVHLSCWKVC